MGKWGELFSQMCIFEEATMLGRWMLSVAFAAFAGFAQAGSWADSMFVEHAKDFGSVPRGPTLVHEFKVKNNSNSDVHISNVRVSCGCVNATAAKSDLKPNEETSIIARMDSNRFSGSKSVTIYVTFDRPKYDEVRLQVMAYGRNDFAVYPESFQFGQIKRGATPEIKVQVRFYGHPEVNISEVITESTFLKSSVTEIKRQGSEITFEAALKATENIPVGKWYSDIWLKTNIAGAGNIRVPVHVEVEAPLTVNPSNLSIGKVKMGETSEKKIVVRGSSPFKIVALEGMDESWQIKDLPQDKKEVHVITVSFKATRPGDSQQRLIIKTDLGENSVVEFTTRASVEK